MNFKKFQLRKVTAWVHRWVSLILGLFLIVVTLSGTALVFRPEIDHALYPNLYKATPGTPSWEKMAEAAEKAYPGYSVSFITHPSDQDIAYEVAMTKDDASLSVYVDPGTNKVLGAHDPSATLMGWFETLHLELFLGETGTFIEGILGLCLIFLLITGFYLWWPGIKKWMLGWTVHWKRGWYIRHYDLHKVIGIVTFPLLFVITITGIAFCLYPQAESIWDTVTNTQPVSYDASITPPKKDTPLVSLDVLANAARKASGGVPTQVIPSSDPSSSAVVWTSVPFDPYVSDGTDGQVPVYINQFTGQVIRVDDPAKNTIASQIFYNWFLALHIGSYGRTPLRVVYVIVGLAPTVLAITGLCMWLTKRSLRKKQQRLKKERLAQKESAPTLEAEEAQLEIELDAENVLDAKL